MCGDRVGLRRTRQGRAAITANLEGVIASNFEGLDLTAPIVVVSVVAALTVGGISRALWASGRAASRPDTARPRRALQAAMRHAGQAGMVAAAAILVGGTWIALQQKSVDQIQREKAATACAEDYPRFRDWEAPGQSLDNWWTGDPLPPGPPTSPVSKKAFMDRCVDMTID